MSHRNVIIREMIQVAHAPIQIALTVWPLSSGKRETDGVAKFVERDSVKIVDVLCFWKLYCTGRDRNPTGAMN